MIDLLEKPLFRSAAAAVLDEDVGVRREELQAPLGPGGTVQAL